jgi:hypothetical protein
VPGLPKRGGAMMLKSSPTRPATSASALIVPPPAPRIGKERNAGAFLSVFDGTADSTIESVCVHRLGITIPGPDKASCARSIRKPQSSVRLCDRLARSSIVLNRGIEAAANLDIAAAAHALALARRFLDRWQF